MKDINILAIESSCDETAAAVVRNRRQVLSNVIASQIDIHTLYGGVVPEIASRKHLENVNRVVEKAMAEAGTAPEDIDAVAVTKGPGLVGALVIGISEAKALAWSWDRPLIGVHHIRGHISAAYIEHEDLRPPFITLVASGGHTMIVRVRDYEDMEVLGASRDDAAGEAFDKVARVIGLGYPGGPEIDEKAKQGDAEAVRFTRPYLEKGSLDFSFSGIKTQVINYVHSREQKNEAVPQADIAAAFQEAVTEVMADKTLDAAGRCGLSRIALTGGVAANSRLRAVFEEKCAGTDMRLFFPSRVYCTDNAAMIGACAYERYIRGEFDGLDLDAYADLEL